VFHPHLSQPNPPFAKRVFIANKFSFGLKKEIQKGHPKTPKAKADIIS